jgi:hypothetical protein
VQEAGKGEETYARVADGERLGLLVAADADLKVALLAEGLKMGNETEM